MPFARGDDTAAGVIQPCKPDVVPDRVTSEPRGTREIFRRCRQRHPAAWWTPSACWMGAPNWPLRQKPSSLKFIHLSVEPERLVREVRHVIAEANSLNDE